jgi:hypothetical protein
MVNTQSLKLQLVQEIINLPDEALPLVRDFIEDLVAENGMGRTNGAKHSKAPKAKKGKLPKPTLRRIDRDPILNFIGLASYHPPANSIDEELYGY